MVPSNPTSLESSSGGGDDEGQEGEEEEVASLPSESTTSSDLHTLSDDYSDAEEEWRESIAQLEMLLSMVLVPFIGKFLGRKCAYWGKSPQKNKNG